MRDSNSSSSSRCAGQEIIGLQVRLGGLASARPGHTRAKHPGGPAEHKAWWCGCERVPLAAGGWVGRFRPEPCQLRRCVESGEDWREEPDYTNDDGETGSGVLLGSAVVRGDDP